MSGPQASEHAELAVPREHGQLLISPQFSELVSSLQQRPRVESLGHSEYAFCGLTLSSLRRAARKSTVSKAIAYTSGYRNVRLPQLNGQKATGTSTPPKFSELSDLPIIMGGHQPDLFHCGVWFKNFLLSNLAESSGALAIHFLVDNDLCRSTSIQVPIQVSMGPGIESSDPSREDCLRQSMTGRAVDGIGEFPRAPIQWQVKSVPYDIARSPVPWESCLLQDSDCWHTFPERVLRELPPLRGQPLVNRLWELVRPSVRPGVPIGRLLSQARHQLEEELGLNTLEVALSQLVSSPEFACFSIQLLSELPRLHEIYNTELVQYRKAHRIRNHAQPLPGLAHEPPWYEAPWWYYRQGSHERLPLWVCRSGEELKLSNRLDWQITLEAPLNSEHSIELWMQQLSQGVCLRPRALLTTMYARLILSDLFIHGMGGARYDQLTDRIIEKFFGIQPPPLGFASATLHLPFQGIAQGLDQPCDQAIAEWQQRLRAGQSSPETALAIGADELPAEQLLEYARLKAEKQALLASIPPKGEKWQWHNDMKRINERLGQMAQPSLARIQATIARLQESQKQHSIILSREFSFSLFPQATIEEHLKKV